MHRFVAEMDAHRAPPGMWSPLALAVLTMAGGVGVGLGLLSLLLPLGRGGGGLRAGAGLRRDRWSWPSAWWPSWADTPMGWCCSGGWRWVWRPPRAGPDRLDPGRHARSGAGSGAVLRTGRLAGAGQQCLLCLRRLPDGAAGDGPARGPPALTAPAVPGAAATWRCWTSPWTAPPPGASAACGLRARIPARLAGRSARLAT